MPVPEHPEGKEPLDQLLRRLRPRLKQLLLRYHVPAHDAEDLVQEALVSTIQKWQEIQDPEAWILVTLKNRCVVYWRKRRASLYNSVDTVILEMLTEPVSAPQERAELLLDLNDLMDGLPPRCRRLLRLRYGLGYDPSEVAERMGYHPASVRKVARRCMAALTYQMVARGFSRDGLTEALGTRGERLTGAALGDPAGPTLSPAAPQATAAAAAPEREPDLDELTGPLRTGTK